MEKVLLSEISDVTKLAGFEFTKYIKYIEDGDIIAIRALNLKDGTLVLDDVKRISKEVSESLERSQLRKNDIVISYTGTIGECAQITEDGKYHLAPNVAKITPKSNIDPDYLFQYIRSSMFRELMKSYCHGSTQPTIPMRTIRELPVYILPFDEQKKVASLLKSIDSKIDENKQINKNLEQQAQAVFKSWFVGFKPFGGVMPEGWKITTFGDVCYNQRERTLSNDYTVFSAVNTGELQPSTEYFTKQVFSKDISNYLKVPQKAFAYNPARVNIGSIGLNTFDYDGCVSPVYVVFTVEDNYEAYFNYIIKTPSFKEEVKTRASGSVRQSLNYRDLALIELTYPDKHTAKMFNDFFWFIHSVKRKISEESNILIELRDTLLPKLMSGELDVSSIDL